MTDRLLRIRGWGAENPPPYSEVLTVVDTDTGRHATLTIGAELVDEPEAHEATYRRLEGHLTYEPPNLPLLDAQRDMLRMNRGIGPSLHGMGNDGPAAMAQRYVDTVLAATSMGALDDVLACSVPL